MSRRSSRGPFLATAMLIGTLAALAAPQNVSAQPQEGEPQATPAEEAPTTAPPEQPDTARPQERPEASPPAGARERESADIMPEAGTPDAAAEPVSDGLLGKSSLFDILVLLAAALVGALGGLLSPWSRSADRLRADHAAIVLRLRRIETGLKAQETLSAPAPTPAGPRYEPFDTRRRGSPLPHPEDGYQLHRDGGPSSDAAAAPRREEQERNGKMERALAEYGKLVATKGSKPRQFTQLLAEFPEARAIRLDHAQGLSTEPFREGDANQFAVAVGDGRRFAVLPTYEYVSDFSIAFSAPVQNPDFIRQLFEFVADDTGQLRVESAAVVEIDETGAVQIVRRGRLAGFRS